MNSLLTELSGAWLAVLHDFPSTVFLYCLFTGLFAALAVFFPFRRGQPSLLSRRVGMDSVYWFISGPSVVLLFAVSWGILGAANIHHKLFYDLSSYPFWLQFICTLLVVDFIGYWVHRALHNAPRWIWRVHVIHHGSTELDWLSTARNHPLNNFVIGFVTFFFLGSVVPEATLFVATFNVCYTAFVHANIDWNLGPLRYVVASPVFHRWHHTFPDEGGNKNFAPVFSCFDLAFGTFYMPTEKRPVRLGTIDRVPKSFAGQLVYPFWRSKVKSEA